MVRLWTENPLRAAEISMGLNGWLDEELEIADAALDDTFFFKDRHEMERCLVPVHFDSRIDWDLVPYGDVEWNFAFNRHTFLLHLAKAYAATREEKYRDGWIRLFLDFLDNTDYKDEISRKLCWRSLETGIRIENHLRSYEIIDRISPFSGEVACRMKESLRMHIDLLLEERTAFHRLSNWGVQQDHGLFLAALFLGDDEALKTAEERIEEETFLQIFPDGSSWEQASMYHAEVLRALLDTILIAGRNDIALPDSVLENTRKLAEALAYSLRPDRYCYLSGDSDEIDMNDLLWRSAMVFSSPGLAWFASPVKPAEIVWDYDGEAGLPEPEKPVSLSRYFPDGGQVYVRMDDTTALRFRAGLYGSGHGSLDQLHFDLHVKDKTLLSDTGRYTYVPGKDRALFKGTWAHNTIVIDSEEMGDPDNAYSKAPEGFMTRSVIEKDYSYSEGCSLAYLDRGVFIRRRILTFHADVVVVIDELAGTGTHEALSLFHFSPDAAVELDGSEVKADGSLLVFGGNVRLSLSEFPFSLKYNEKTMGPLVSAAREFSGRRLDYLVIFPKGSGSVTCFQPEKSLSGRKLPEDKALAFRIAAEGREYELCVIAEESRTGGYLVKAGETEAYAKVFFREKGSKTVRIN